MSLYHPNRWKLIKISSSKNTHYRVFGTWSGGYLDGASWKLSSGCTGKPIAQATEEIHGWNLPQSSGSVYYLGVGAEGICGGWHGKLDELIENSKSEGITIEVIDNPNFEKTDFDVVQKTA